MIRSREKLRSIPSWRALLWLAFRQGGVVWLTVAAAGFVLGILVPFSETAMLLWPPATAAIGVFCGIGVFAPEQTSGSYKFLGVQRFPAGRVWWAKTFIWLGAAMVAAMFIQAGFFLHLAVAADTEQKHWRDVLKQTEEVRKLASTGIFITYWLVLGFSIGQFFSLVWRKSIVAVVVSLFLAAIAAALSFPSIVSGGVHWWQVFALPILLLASTRLCICLWVLYRLNSARSALLLTGGGLLAFASLIGGICYRVVEVPDVGEPFNVKAFVASIPDREHDEAAVAIKKALDEANQNQIEADRKLGPPKPIRLKPPKAELPKPDGQADRPDMVPAGDGPGELEIPVTNYFDLIDRFLSGFPLVDDPQLIQWLDLVFQGEWMKRLSEAVELPLAVLTDPRTGSLERYTKL